MREVVENLAVVVGLKRMRILGEKEGAFVVTRLKEELVANDLDTRLEFA